MSDPSKAGQTREAAGLVIAGRYRLEREIGSGGMATVWEATHLTLQRSIAIKLIDLAGPQSARLTDRFLREARVAAAIRHRNVVDIIDFGTTEQGRPYMAMELLVGRPLSKLLASGDVITVGQAVRIMARALSGLGAVHDAGIVHRDLKPENIFLVEDADGVYPKLLDFGVSRADPRTDLESVMPTQENVIVGTPQYMSPEQARVLKNLDHRSDLWSAGVILYELLAGEVPFEADAVGDIIIQIATEDPPPLEQHRPDLAGPLCDVVMRALKRSPDDRFTDAREMRAALLAAANETAANLEAGTRQRVTVETHSDMPPPGAVDLRSAVNAAYEPGDSGLLDFGEHIADSPMISGERPSLPAIPPPRRPGGPDPFAAPPKRRVPIGAVIGAAVMISLIGGGVGAALFFEGAPWPTAEPASTPPATVAIPEEPPPVTEPVAAEPAPEPTPAREVTITLERVPEGATVSIDDVEQTGSGPFEVTHGVEHRVEVSSDDGRTWGFTHPGDANATYAVELPEPQARRRRRRRGRRRTARGNAATEPAARPSSDMIRSPGF